MWHYTERLWEKKMVFKFLMGLNKNLGNFIARDESAANTGSDLFSKDQLGLLQKMFGHSSN